MPTKLSVRRLRHRWCWLQTLSYLTTLTQFVSIRPLTNHWLTCPRVSLRFQTRFCKPSKDESPRKHSWQRCRSDTLWSTLASADTSTFGIIRMRSKEAKDLWGLSNRTIDNNEIIKELLTWFNRTASKIQSGALWSSIPSTDVRLGSKRARQYLIAAMCSYPPKVRSSCSQSNASHQEISCLFRNKVLMLYSMGQLRLSLNSRNWDECSMLVRKAEFQSFCLRTLQLTLIKACWWRSWPWLQGLRKD